MASTSSRNKKDCPCLLHGGFPDLDFKAPPQPWAFMEPDEDPESCYVQPALVDSARIDPPTSAVSIWTVGISVSVCVMATALVSCLVLLLLYFRNTKAVKEKSSLYKLNGHSTTSTGTSRPTEWSFNSTNPFTPTGHLQCRTPVPRTHSTRTLPCSHLYRPLPCVPPGLRPRSVCQLNTTSLECNCPPPPIDSNGNCCDSDDYEQLELSRSAYYYADTMAARSKGSILLADCDCCAYDAVDPQTRSHGFKMAQSMVL